MIRSAASATICVALQAWVLSAAFVRDGLKSSVNLTSRLLEHFHFYSEQDRAAKCGFS